MTMLQRRQVFKKAMTSTVNQCNWAHFIRMGTRSERYLISTSIMHIIIILYSWVCDIYYLIISLISY